MSGESALQEMIDAFRGLESLPAATAREAAPLLEEALRTTAAAGVSPDGNPWAPKKDGGRAMPGAAKAIAAKAFGNVVRVTLTGPEVFHHFGKGSSEVRRPVIPDAGGELPAVAARAVEKGAELAFARIMGGGR